MVNTKIHQFCLFVLMHADMTAVTIQSDKMVWNEVNDNQALLEPTYRKRKMNIFGQPNTLK